MPLSVALPRDSAVVLLGRDGAPSPSDLCGSERGAFLTKKSTNLHEWGAASPENVVCVFIREIGGSEKNWSLHSGMILQRNLTQK
jgi:hypothetical protein